MAANIGQILMSVRTRTTVSMGHALTSREAMFVSAHPTLKVTRLAQGV